MISQSVQTSFVPLSALPRAFRLCFFFALIASVFVPSWPVFHVNSFLSLPQFTDILLLLLLFWHPDSILCWIHVCLLLMIPNTYSSTLGSELSWNFLIACTPRTRLAHSQQTGCRWTSNLTKFTPRTTRAGSPPELFGGLTANTWVLVTAICTLCWGVFQVTLEMDWTNQVSMKHCSQPFTWVWPSCDD